MKVKQLTVKPVFVRNKNVRDFEVMMDALAQSKGEGRMGMVFGQAGLGKTRTAQWYAAHNRCIYLRMLSIWKTAEIDFLSALAREAGIASPPKKKAWVFAEIVERLLPDPRPIFIDEPEKMPRPYLELFRDLSDTTTCPIIMIGEEELPGYLGRDRRIWTRTFYIQEFERLQVSDIMSYALEAADMKVSSEVAAVLLRSGDGHRVTDGNFRVVKRALMTLAQIMNSYQTTEATAEMAVMAMKKGL